MNLGFLQLDVIETELCCGVGLEIRLYYQNEYQMMVMIMVMMLRRVILEYVQIGANALLLFTSHVLQKKRKILCEMKISDSTMLMLNSSPHPPPKRKRRKGKEIPSSCLHFLSKFMLFYAFDYSNMKLVLLDCYNYAHWMCSGECILMVISTFQFGSFQM